MSFLGEMQREAPRGCGTLLTLSPASTPGTRPWQQGCRGLSPSRLRGLQLNLPGSLLAPCRLGAEPLGPSRVPPVSLSTGRALQPPPRLSKGEWLDLHRIRR